ncbi:MAG TPA: Crp/Fnr family transcriptional regulator [Desulfobacterales bacterium]
MACTCEEIAGKDASLSPVCIGHLWMFENLQEPELVALLDVALRKQYPIGAAVFSQGQPADRMFLIKGGRIKLSRVSEDGAEVTLDIRKPGDVLGENVLGEDEPAVYPLSAWSMESSLLCGITRTHFEQLVLRHPNIGLQMIKNLSRRIARLTDRVGGMGETRLENRLYQTLVHFAREHGVETARGLAIELPLTHEELSFLVGAHRVSVTRALKGLREAGRIQQEGRIWVLTNEPE